MSTQVRLPISQTEWLHQTSNFHARYDQIKRFQALLEAEIQETRNVFQESKIEDHKLYSRNQCILDDYQELRGEIRKFLDSSSDTTALYLTPALEDALVSHRNKKSARITHEDVAPLTIQIPKPLNRSSEITQTEGELQTPISTKSKSPSLFQRIKRRVSKAFSRNKRGNKGIPDSALGIDSPRPASDDWSPAVPFPESSLGSPYVAFETSPLSPKSPELDWTPASPVTSDTQNETFEATASPGSAKELRTSKPRSILKSESPVAADEEKVPAGASSIRSSRARSVKSVKIEEPVAEVAPIDTAELPSPTSTETPVSPTDTVLSAKDTADETFRLIGVMKPDIRKTIYTKLLKNIRVAPLIEVPALLITSEQRIQQIIIQGLMTADHAKVSIEANSQESWDALAEMIRYHPGGLIPRSFISRLSNTGQADVEQLKKIMDPVNFELWQLIIAHFKGINDKSTDLLLARQLFASCFESVDFVAMLKSIESREESFPEDLEQIKVALLNPDNCLMRALVKIEEDAIGRKELAISLVSLFEPIGAIVPLVLESTIYAMSINRDLESLDELFPVDSLTCMIIQHHFVHIAAPFLAQWIKPILQDVLKETIAGKYEIDPEQLEVKSFTGKKKGTGNTKQSRKNVRKLVRVAESMVSALTRHIDACPKNIRAVLRAILQSIPASLTVDAKDLCIKLLVDQLINPCLRDSEANGLISLRDDTLEADRQRITTTIMNIVRIFEATRSKKLMDGHLATGNDKLPTVYAQMMVLASLLGADMKAHDYVNETVETSSIRADEQREALRILQRMIRAHMSEISSEIARQQSRRQEISSNTAAHVEFVRACLGPCESGDRASVTSRKRFSIFTRK